MFGRRGMSGAPMDLNEQVAWPSAPHWQWRPVACCTSAHARCGSRLEPSTELNWHSGTYSIPVPLRGGIWSCPRGNSEGTALPHKQKQG